MDKLVESDLSSSEDEVYMEAIKEAADQNLLTDLLLQSEGKKNSILNNTLAPDANDLDKDQYSTHGLTQSCRDFIAKKLVEKINEDILLEDAEITSNSRKTIAKKDSGIKLFSDSNTILTTVNDDDDITDKKKTYRKRILHTFDEKANMLRCKEVALDSQTILSQHDMKHWVRRKHRPELKYKKSKNGILLQVN